MSPQLVLSLCVALPPVGVPLLILQTVTQLHRVASDVFVCAVIDAGLVPEATRARHPDTAKSEPERTLPVPALPSAA